MLQIASRKFSLNFLIWNSFEMWLNYNYLFPPKSLQWFLLTFENPTHLDVEGWSESPLSPPLSFPHYSSLSLIGNAKLTALSPCAVIHCLSRIFHISLLFHLSSFHGPTNSLREPLGFLSPSQEVPFLQHGNEHTLTLATLPQLLPLFSDLYHFSLRLLFYLSRLSLTPPSYQ